MASLHVFTAHTSIGGSAACHVCLLCHADLLKHLLLLHLPQTRLLPLLMLCVLLLLLLQVSRASYGKLARLYRNHWLSSTSAVQTAAAAGCSVGLALEAAAAALQELEAAAPAAGATAAHTGTKHAAAAGSDDDEETDEEAAAAAAVGADSAHHILLCAEARIAELEQQQQQSSEGAAERAAFHQRVFALLLRYKSIQGHGFQVSHSRKSQFDAWLAGLVCKMTSVNSTATTAGQRKPCSFSYGSRVE
jgi:hypothetical protein